MIRQLLSALLSVVAVCYAWLTGPLGISFKHVATQTEEERLEPKKPWSPEEASKKDLKKLKKKQKKKKKKDLNRSPKRVVARAEGGKTILPNEVLHEVLRWLPRRDLDAAEFSDMRLRPLITDHLHEHSLRRIWMWVGTAGSDRYVGLTDVDNSVSLEDTVPFDSLGEILARAFLTSVFIDCLDDAIISQLLPYSGYYQKSSLCVPVFYDSAEVITRAFSELFFARKICFNDERHYQDGDFWIFDVNILEIPCMQYCEVLDLCSIQRLSSICEHLANWLSGSGSKKRFSIPVDIETLPEEVNELSDLLLEAITPMFVFVLPLGAGIVVMISGAEDLRSVIVSATSFCSWIPVVNPIFTIYFIKPYRQALFGRLIAKLRPSRVVEKFQPASTTACSAALTISFDTP